MSLRQRLPLVGVFIVLLVLAVLAYAVPGRAEETEQASSAESAQVQVQDDFGRFVVEVPLETPAGGDVEFAALLDLAVAHAGTVHWHVEIQPVGGRQRLSFPGADGVHVDAPDGTAVRFPPVVAKEVSQVGAHEFSATLSIGGNIYRTGKAQFGVRHESAAKSYVYVNFDQVTTHVHDYPAGQVTYRFTDGRTVKREMTLEERMNGDYDRTAHYSQHNAKRHQILVIREPKKDD